GVDEPAAPGGVGVEGDVPGAGLAEVQPRQVGEGDSDRPEQHDLFGRQSGGRPPVDRGGDDRGERLLCGRARARSHHSLVGVRGGGGDTGGGTGPGGGGGGRRGRFRGGALGGGGGKEERPRGGGETPRRRDQQRPPAVRVQRVDVVLNRRAAGRTRRQAVDC